jgi:hypothetical protein
MGALYRFGKVAMFCSEHLLLDFMGYDKTNANHSTNTGLALGSHAWT